MKNEFFSNGKLLFFIIASFFLISFVSAEPIQDDIHLNIQTIDDNEDIVTGTFSFVFNISNSSDCSVGNVLYSNSTNLTTDSRGIISYYLEDVTLDFDEQYWLCYYRDGTLEETIQLAQTPYAFRATNLNATGYNITADTGFFDFLGSLTDRITKLFVQDADISNNLTVLNNLSVGGGILFVDTNSRSVGINTTTPAVPLHVATDINRGSAIFGLGGDATDLGFGWVNNSAYHRFRSAGAGNDNILLELVDPDSQYFAVKGGFNIDGETSLGYSAGAVTPPENGLLVSGNVGINTTTPRARLEVRNDSNGVFQEVIRISNEGSGGNTGAQIGFGWGNTKKGFIGAYFDGITSVTQIGDASGGVINLRTGLVGINTTSPSHTLNVVGDANITGSVTSQNDFCIEGGACLSTTASDGISWTIATNGTLANTQTSNTFGAFNQTFDTNTFFIDSSSDKVGIGTTSPNVNSKLDVKGAISSNGGFLVNNNANIGLLTSGNDLVLSAFGDSIFKNYNGSAYDENLRIDGDGNLTVDTDTLFVDAVSDRVGIGTTSPRNELEVEGTGRFNTQVQTDIVKDEASGDFLLHYVAPDLYIGASSAGLGPVTDILINPSGNVGIGNSSPVEKLVVQDGAGGEKISFNVDNNPAIIIDDTGSDAILTTLGTLSTSGFVGTNANANFQILTNNIARATFDTSGNVGIGNTTPQRELVVGGVIEQYIDANTHWRTSQRDVGLIGFLGNGLDYIITFDTINQRLGVGGVGGTPGNKLSVGGGASIGSNYYLNTSPTNGLIVEGDVGIGTVSPSAKLHLNGSTTSLFSITNSTTGTSVFNVSNDGEIIAASGALNINSLGGITTTNGIAVGTGVPASAIGQVNVYASSTQKGSLNTGSLDLFDTQPIRWSSTSSSQGTKDVGLSRLSAGVLGVGDGTTGTSDSTLIAGNVGIGTASPGEELDVNGSIKAEQLALGGGGGVDSNQAILLYAPKRIKFAGVSTNWTLGNEDGGSPLTIKNGSGSIRYRTSPNGWTTIGGNLEIGALGVLNTVSTSADVLVARGTSGQTGDIIQAQDSSENRLFVVNASGSVGINTSTPQNKLNVVGDANITGTLYAGGVDGVLSDTGDTATGNYTFDSGTLFVNANDGRIGIGTTSPNAPLHINGGSVGGGIHLEGANNFDSSFRIYEGSTNTFAISQSPLSNKTDFQNYISGDDLRILTNFGDFTINTANGAGTNVLTVLQNNGNIGIGTTTPQNTLEVEGDINISRTSTNRLILPLSNDATTPTISFGDGDTGFFESSDDVLRIALAGATVWTADASTFGSTAAGYPVIRAEASSTTNPTLTPYGGDADTGIGGDGSNTVALIAGGSTGLVYNGTTGNVGINTSTPESTLEIDAGTTDLIFGPVWTGGVDYAGLTDRTPDADSYFLLTKSGASDRYINAPSGGQLNFRIGNSLGNDLVFDGTAFSIDNTGFYYQFSTDRVGIGTASPSAPLSVVSESASSFNFDLVGRSIDNKSTIRFMSSDGFQLTSITGDTNGNLGIGTTAPQNTLHVIGDGNFTGALYANGGIVADNSSIAAYIDAKDSSFNTSVANWVSGNFISNTGDNGTGEYNFNNGWTAGGLTISGGDIFAQTGYFYNISSLNVNSLEINGTIEPDMDDTFDLGSSSLRWRDLYTSRNVNLSDVLYVEQSSGEVGIGTDTPTYKLDVQGTSNTVGIRVNSDTIGDILYYGTGTVAGSTNFFQAVINASGNVAGIIKNSNTASSSANAFIDLNVGGANSGDPYTQYTVSAVQNWITGIDNSDSDKYKIANGSSFAASTLLTIDNSGNVGIGTTSPTESLDIDGPGEQFLRLDSSDNSGDVGLKFLGAGNRGGIRADGNYNIFIEPNDQYATTPTQRGHVIINSGPNGTGLLGVGTTSPTSRLHVNGTNKTSAFHVQGRNATGTTVTQLYIENSSGKVGIGTSSPGSDLDLDKGGATFKVDLDSGVEVEITDTEPRLDFTSTVYDDFVLNIDSTGFNIQEAGVASRLNIDFDGKVGIGTTSPESVLHVSGDQNSNILTLNSSSASGQANRFYLDGTFGRQLIISSNWDYENSSSDGTGTTSVVGLTTGGSNNAAAFEIRTGTTGVQTPTTRLVVMPGGNVGIATTTPQNTLNVVGDGNFTGNLYSNGQLVGSGSLNSTGWNKSGSSIYLANTGDSVGIGTTSPTKKLHVNGSAAISDSITLSNSGSTAWEIYNGNIAGSVLSFEIASGTTRDVVFANTLGAGVNVGINTTSPQATLHVSGGDLRVNGGIFVDSSGNVQLVDTSRNIYNLGGTVRAGTGNGLSFQTNASSDERVVITPAGNVGINTSSPDATLHVDGDSSDAIRVSSGNTSRYGKIYYGSSLVLDTVGTGSGVGGVVIRGKNNIQIGAGSGAGNILLADQGGNVGVGLSASSLYRFGVIGGDSGGRDVNLSGTLFVNGSNVGIGEKAPATTLEIAGTTADSSLTSDSGIFTVTGSNTAQLSIGSEDGSPFGIYLQAKDAGNGGGAYPILLNPNNGNVGIGTTDPQNTLNVIGDGNFTGNLYANGQLVGSSSQNSTGWNRSGTNVFLANNGDNVGINTSSPSELLELAGNFVRTAEDSSSYQSKQYIIHRNVETGVGNTTDIGNFTFTQGAGYIEIDHLTAGSGYSVAAKYLIPVQYNNVDQGIFGEWLEVQPISYTGDYSGNEVGLDINISSGKAELRLRRVGGSVNATHTLDIKTLGNTVTFAPSEAKGTDSAPGTAYGSAVLTQRAGSVGINTTNPGKTLTVVGDASISGNTTIATNVLHVNANANRIGIVTTTPEANLHVQGNVDIRSATYFSASSQADRGTLTWASGVDGDLRLTAASGYDLKLGSGGSVGQLTILNGTGNIGIGTTAPTYPLEVNHSTDPRIALTGNNAVIGSEDGTLTVANQNAAGKIYFAIGSNALTNNNNRLAVLNENGSFGINTTTPQNTLNVVGDGNFTTALYVNNKNLEVGYDYAINSSGSLTWAEATNGTLANTQASNTFGAFNQTFDTNTLFVNTDDGRVGIGTTSPGQLLEVNGNLLTKSLFLPGTNTVDIGIDVGEDFQLGHWNSSSSTFTPRIAFDSSGKVGINTTSPNNLLEVTGAPASIRINSTNSGQTALYLTSSSTNTQSLYIPPTTDDLRISVLGNDVVHFDSSQRVGVKTNSPTHTLTVSGGTTGGKDVNLSDTLFVNGSNVGIGTTSPIESLTINGDITTIAGTFNQRGIHIGHQNNVNVSYIGRSENGVVDTSNRLQWDFDDNTFTVDNDGDISLRAGTSGDLFVGSTGLIGINTMSPSHTLTVKGTLNITQASGGGTGLIFHNGTGICIGSC